MTESDLRPRLRNVELSPFKDGDGRQMFALRDPQQISPQVLGISPEIASVLQFLDGTRTLEEIHLAYQMHWKREIPPDYLAHLVRTLDKAYFLNNGNFRIQLAKLVESFQRAEVREAYHAGNGYAKEAVGLKESLTTFFAPPRGPGYPNGGNSERDIHGMIVPHIDLRLGGHSYAWAYKELAEARRPDIVVVLGTGHSGLKNLFSLTSKSFDTPMGRLQVDTEFVKRLTSLCPYDLFSEEFAHRTEHTIEFQVLFLQLLFGTSVTLVPILCSFGHRMAAEGEAAKMITQFVEALRTAVSQESRSVCLVASADLAHVGPRYGDPEGFEGERLEQIKKADVEMLSHVEKVDGQGFLDYITREEDRRRICGLSPIYTLLQSLDATKGTVLSHDHGEMDASGSVCSFASVIFES